MPKQIVNAYNPDKMSEDAEYVLKNLLHALKPIEKLLEGKADQREVSDLASLIEKLSENVCTVHEASVDSVNILSDKIEKLTTAVLALATKLDAEDVTNLDKNYNSVVSSNL